MSVGASSLTGFSSVAVATDLPYEIAAKSQPVYQPANSIENDAHGKKNAQNLENNEN